MPLRSTDPIKGSSMKAVSLLLGIVIGFPTGLVITAKLADKFETFDLGRALGELLFGGIFGAIVGGTIGLVIAMNMQDRR